MIDLVREKVANVPDIHPRPRAAPAPLDRSRVPAPRSVAIVVYDGVTLFELGVACDVFGTNDLTDQGVPWYTLSICGVGPDLLTTDGGLRLDAPYGLGRLSRVDTVVVPPTEHLDRVPARVFEALRRAHARGCRIISLCTGAFVLAEAGLLDGRRATTHWSECDELGRRYPKVLVDPAVLYVDAGDILTSAGSAASIDLCLHVVRSDYGTEVATRLARQLVVPPQRDGGQAQFIDMPMPTLDRSDRFAETVAWAQEHLNEAVTVNDLAARSAMSPRTFARRFAAATGTTPHQWLQHQRVHLAQRLLETSDLPIEMVAETSGLCTASNLRKHFARTLRTSPQAYRRSFRDRRVPQDGFGRTIDGGGR
jgi:AraC family transcriptional regulator, transcriptional activator FtrA